MAQISVTPEMLNEQAKVYLQAQQQIQAANAAVARMNQQIEQEWQGAAFQAYLGQYEQLSSQVGQFEQLLVDINGQLVKYAQTVQDRDVADSKSFGF